MHVINLSLDPIVLDTDSVVASRSVRYGQALDSYTIFVPATTDQTTVLSQKVSVHGVAGAHKFIQLYRLYKQVQLQVVKGTCDVITTQDTYFLALLGFFIAKKYHLGLEVQVLGFEKLNWFRKQLSLSMLTRASSVRVVSQGVAQRLKNEFGFTEKHIHIVPMYTDVSSLGFGSAHTTPKQQEALASHVQSFVRDYGRRCNFLTVSRLVPVKNISLQLQAVARLKTKHPELLLHIVGDGPLQAQLTQEIQKLGIAAHVIVHGAKFGPELSCFYTQSDCFVLTSHSEGWGMVVIEAASAGLPVIMTNVGCAGEVIHDDDSGVIIQDNDLSALVAAMDTLISDEPRRQKLGQAARDSIQSLPSFDSVVEKYVASWRYAEVHRL